MPNQPYRPKHRAKKFFFPGFDLHTRCRYRFLPKFFRKGAVDTLDAGCGNGALAFAAYLRGNRVLGISNNREQIHNIDTFFSLVGADTDRLHFEACDLYDLAGLGRSFDQIICSETLEHIADHATVVEHFYDVLRPGGVLHLCAPYALHPEHALGRVHGPEDGGHVRDGYTIDSYRALLETKGFDIRRSAGLGSPLLVLLDRLLRGIRSQLGDAAAVPLFLLFWPLLWFDYLDPKTPYSLYIQAVKHT